VAEKLRIKLKRLYNIENAPRVVLVPDAMIQEVDIGDGWTMHGAVDYVLGITDSLDSSTSPLAQLRLCSPVY
jgi:hypothetical protein